ncbi:MAG: CBS domain-containing protein [Anaerolinea sp.]|nr:CBS domain-containing protein [Anaerolinea sp.]
MQTVTVAEVCQTPKVQALVVSRKMPLAEAIWHFVQDHDLRGIFLTDENGRLVGVVNKQDLLAWVRLELSLATETLSAAQVRRVVLAETVGDLARADSAETAVTLHDTLATALNKMVRYNQTDIPVVDGDGRIVNDLRLSEVLAYVLRET